MRIPNPLITKSPSRLGGTPVFAGTRVPVRTLIEHLEAGDSLDAFLEDFPSSLSDLRSRLASRAQVSSRVDGSSVR
ncbi:MAG: DUF433 domain-containing protein [Gammaproteobacteria bacterium]|nr:DUF433 domain-containing protein [Gammaproteobacteria bacterium]